MLNVLKKNNSKFLLIGKINGLSAESKRARLRLRHVDQEKNPWFIVQRHRLLGIDIRHHLLAYAFLRGLPYQKVETTCRANHLPKPKAIYQIVATHAPAFVPYDFKARTGGQSFIVTEEDIVKWLQGA